MYTKATVYGGWRHSTFVYPTLVVAAALGFNTLINWAKNKKVKIAFTVLPVVLLFDPLIFTIKNHPYEYTYFNRFVGGTKGAYGNYEMDYYGHTIREASEWILADVAKNGAPDPTRKTLVATGYASDYFFRKDTANFSINYVGWEKRNTVDWDYAFYSVVGDHYWGLTKEAYPPKNTVYQIMVDGVPCCYQRFARWVRGTIFCHIRQYPLRCLAFQQGNLDEAQTQLLKAFEYDAYDEQALDDLIQIGLATGKPADIDLAIDLTNYWLGFHKNNVGALYMLGVLYFSKGDFANAMSVGNTIMEIEPRSVDGLLLVATVYAQQNDLNAAWHLLNKIIVMQRDNKRALEMMLNVAYRMGDEDAAQLVRERLKNLE
ncbi:hypothetical protein AGMMS4957_14550 [Bacteroidia bacterium]|nr:hypothetical protein AGMMS4957_14550 [Bacteroidia bacterium]